MAINLRVKTAIVQRTVTDPNNGHVYTIDGAVAVGNDAYGRCWASKSAGAKIELVSITPAQTLDGANIVNGAMKNPIRGEPGGPQGWDQRMADWDAARNLILPALLTTNDIVVKTVARIAALSRAGCFTSTSALHVLDATPTGEFLLPSPVGWTGRSTFAPYPINTTAWLAAKTTYAGGTWPTFDQIEASLSKASPTMAYRSGTDVAGYEGFSVFGLGGTSNYGLNQGRTYGVSLLAMVSTAYTDTQRRRFAIANARIGLDNGEAALRGDEFFQPNGGHYQWSGFPLVHALDLIGENASIPNVLVRAGGNMRQPFVSSSALRTSHFSPHTSASLPNLWRRRTLGAQPGGNVVRIPCSSALGDDVFVGVPIGGIVTQFGGGKTANVIAQIDLAESGTVDVQLDVTSPFLAGEEIYIDVPAGWKADNQASYSILGYTGAADNLMQFSANSGYRTVQGWGGQMLAIWALGLYDPTMEACRRYLQATETANFPTSSNNYASLTRNAFITTNTPLWFYNTHYVPL